MLIPPFLTLSQIEAWGGVDPILTLFEEAGYSAHQLYLAHLGAILRSRGQSGSLLSYWEEWTKERLAAELSPGFGDIARLHYLSSANGTASDLYAGFRTSEDDLDGLARPDRVISDILSDPVAFPRGRMCLPEVLVAMRDEIQAIKDTEIRRLDLTGAHWDGSKRQAQKVFADAAKLYGFERGTSRMPRPELTTSKWYYREGPGGVRHCIALDQHPRAPFAGYVPYDVWRLDGGDTYYGPALFDLIPGLSAYSFAGRVPEYGMELLDVSRTAETCVLNVHAVFAGYRALIDTLPRI